MSEAYQSGQVRRYHANPVMARLGQTNADHQWGCAILIDQLHPDPSLNLVMAALKHDGGELKVGDLAYPFKLAHPEVAAAHAAVEQELAQEIGMGLPELTEEEQEWLKFVDRLESMLYAKLHAPHVFNSPGWAEQTNMVLRTSVKLGCAMKTQQMIGGS